MMNRKYVSKAEDVPAGEHYAILLFSTVYVPDVYDSSGPSVAESRVEYVAYFDRGDWEAEVKRKTQNASSSEGFRAIHVKPAAVTITVSVEVS